MKKTVLPILRHGARLVLYTLLGSVLGASGLYIHLMTDRDELRAWHTVELEHEFTADRPSGVRNFTDYLELEKRLFAELHEKIYRQAPPSPIHELNRFETGSLADPTSYPVNWNRSFVFEQQQPRGGVLLLHGLSDSPYSLLTLARSLHEQGYFVVGLRMPGHGTAPSGLLSVDWQDMATAVRLAAGFVVDRTGRDRPFHIFGYSMGAAQAVNYSLDALKDHDLRVPDSLVLISPAIGVSSVAALAVWQSRLAMIPGLEKLAWNSIGPEYDPYKYTSFAVNAGDLMYRLTLVIDEKFAQLGSQATRFPRILAFLSMVDATVSTGAVVTHLLDRVNNPGNELVLFDLNRSKKLEPFIGKDPTDDFRSLLSRHENRYSLSLVTNESPETDHVVWRRWPIASSRATTVPTGLRWPDHVYSLSHVALPFPPTDDLYGVRPETRDGLHIGLLDSRGEKGVLNVPAGDMLRLRYNPFYDLMQQRIDEFLTEPRAG